MLAVAGETLFTFHNHILQPRYCTELRGPSACVGLSGSAGGWPRWHLDPARGRALERMFLKGKIYQLTVTPRAFDRHAASQSFFS